MNPRMDWLVLNYVKMRLLVDILLQYQIDVRNGVFEVYAFTINSKPQTTEMIDSLIESMCEVVS